jgi:hypothetical protein
MTAVSYSDALFVDDVKVNAWYQFPWLAWCDGEELATAVAKLFQQYDKKIFAASHGNVIRRDVARYIPMLQEGMRRAAAMPYSHHF